MGTCNIEHDDKHPELGLVPFENLYDMWVPPADPTVQSDHLRVDRWHTWGKCSITSKKQVQFE